MAVRGRIGALVACVAAALAVAEGAGACSFDPAPRTLPREAGAACSARQVMEGASVFSLSLATDLGAGFVRQDVSDSFGCGYRRVTLVADCRAGRAAVLPAPEVQVMVGPDTAREAAHDALLAEIATRAESGDPLPVSGIVARGRQVGIDDVAEVPARQRLRLHGWPFSLACACNLYYPEQPERGS